MFELIKNFFGFRKTIENSIANKNKFKGEFRTKCYELKQQTQGTDCVTYHKNHGFLFNDELYTKENTDPDTFSMLEDVAKQINKEVNILPNDDPSFQLRLLLPYLDQKFEEARQYADQKDSNLKVETYKKIEELRVETRRDEEQKNSELKEETMRYADQKDSDLKVETYKKIEELRVDTRRDEEQKNSELKEETRQYIDQKISDRVNREDQMQDRIEEMQVYIEGIQKHIENQGSFSVFNTLMVDAGVAAAMLAALLIYDRMHTKIIHVNNAFLRMDSNGDSWYGERDVIQHPLTPLKIGLMSAGAALVGNAVTYINENYLH